MKETAELKTDLMGMRQKRQCNVGRYEAVILLGSARIREYVKEPSGTCFLRQCLPYFFSPRCVFVGALARKNTNVQKAFHVDANFAFLRLLFS